MSRFIESIKVLNNEPFLLDYHQKRMNKTFLHFGKKNNIDIKDIFNNISRSGLGLYKWRILYDLEGRYSSELTLYQGLEIKTFELIINNSIDYQFKSEDRSLLNEMKAHSKADEIIIVKNNQITDTSYSNLIVLKDGEWYTPELFLLNGVQRQFLLDSKKIKEAQISLENLHSFSHFKMINAMNDFETSPIYSIKSIVNLFDI